MLGSKRRNEKEKYIALIFIFLSFLLLFFPKDLKFKISLFPNSILLKPLTIARQFLLSLKNYQKERDYLYELSLKQNLTLAQLKKISNLTLFSLESLENSYIIRRANIISRDNSLKRYLIIDKGLKDSVMVNFPVVTNEGIVGKVIACSDEISVVETFYSPYSKISAKVQKNNYLTCVGCKGNLLYLDYLDEKCDISENDTIVSTEIGGIFPEGLKIGVVKKIEKKNNGTFNVIIEPVVDLLKIDDVYILQKRLKKIKRDELEILLKQLELKLPEIKFLR